MLRSDARDLHLNDMKNLGNMLNITVDAIARIEEELDPYDLVSVVFLLYDVPDTALQRLIVYERVYKDMKGNTLNLLYDWANHAQSRPSWRFEFLEALAICQLYSVIRKLGFDVTNIRKLYAPDDTLTTFYINPIKKGLYKLCEHTTSDNLERLKNTLKTYEIDTSDYKSCELVLLELMCKKFITIDNLNTGKVSNNKIQLEKLAKIVEQFPGLLKYAVELRELQGQSNDKEKTTRHTGTNIPSPKETSDDIKYYDDDDEYMHDEDIDQFMATAFEEIYQRLSEVHFEEPSVKSLKSDTRKLNKANAIDGAYSINNPKRIGVCYIINQEDFHPSKDSIENNSQCTPLEKRYGSTRDKEVLERTMASLNFEVISHRNLDHKKMIEYIKNIVQYRVHHDDSMFMLCILSHGVRGHVYAADSVKVKIDSIQSLLDETLQGRDLDIPKIMILQACQVSLNEEPQLRIAADNPFQQNSYHLKKLNFLIYWATAPELEAYRDVVKGSIFIQVLCCIIQKHAKQEHLYDIFTKVTDGVAKICTQIRKDQVPIFESTLRKKLYLQIPE